MKKELTSAILSAALMLSALPLSTFADFENTHVNTGNMREDIVAVAETQIGYRDTPEGETLYNHFVGSLPDCPANGYGYAWCQSFVAWCAAQAGISSSIIMRKPGTANVSDDFKDRGLWEVSEACGGTYLPQRGDIIYFDDEPDIGGPSHVGIVTGCADGIVYTIEGNSGSEVRAKEYALNDSYIIGYGVPDYEGSGENNLPVQDSPSAEDGMYNIVNCGTGRYLNYAYGWTAGGGYYPMIACTEDYSPEQTFRISYAGEGKYRIISGYDDSISMNVWAETVNDIMAGCDITGFSSQDNNTQYFRIIPVSEGEFAIASAQNSSLVAGLSEKNGYTHVTLQRYSETNSSQRWSLVRLDEPQATLKGDANCDGTVNVADAVAVMQYIANQDKYPLTDTARGNADCDGEPGISGSDAITIQKADAGIIIL